MIFCKKDFRKAAKDFLDSDEIDSIIQNIDEEMQVRTMDNLLPKARAFHSSVDKLIEERNANLKLLKYQSFLNSGIFKEKSQLITDFTNKKGSPSLGLIANIAKVQSDIEGTSLSTEAAVKKHLNYFRQHFINELQKVHPQAFEILKDKSNDEAISQAMATNGKTKNPIFNKIGITINNVMEELRQSLNSVGANIGTSDEYLYKQTHNVINMLSPTGTTLGDFKLRMKIKGDASITDKAAYLREAAYKRWHDFILPLLDEEQTFKGADIEKFMRGAYNGLIEGHLSRPYAMDEESEKTFRVPSPGNKAQRISKNRVFIFKAGGIPRLTYTKEFGHGSLFNEIRYTLERGAQDYGLMKSLGANPLAMFYRLRQHAIDENARLIKEGKVPDKKLRKYLDEAEIDLRRIMGEYRGDPHTVVGRISNGLRNLLSVSLLGYVVPNSLNDLSIRASKLAEFNDGFFKTTNAFLKDCFSPTNRKFNKEMADQIGAWVHSNLAHSYTKLSDLTSSPDILGQFAQSSFKWYGLEWYDNTMRTGGLGQIVKALGSMKDLSFEQLPDLTKKNLLNYRIDAKDWNLIRAHSIETKQMGHIIGPDVLNLISREEIAKRLNVSPENLTSTREFLYRKRLQERFETFFSDQLDDLQIQPGIRTQTKWLGRSKAGTWEGEIRKMFALFRYFNVESQSRVFGRIIHGQGYNSFLNAVHSGKARVQMASFIVNAIMLTYIAKSSVALLKGMTPPDPANPTTMANLILDSGAAGWWGSWFANDYSGQQTFTSKIFGPTGDMVNQLAKMFSLVKNQEQGKQGDTKRRILNSAYHITKNITPGINAPFIGPALNYLFLYRLQEYLSPGSTKRMVNNAYKKGQEFFIPLTR